MTSIPTSVSWSGYLRKRDCMTINKRNCAHNSSRNNAIFFLFFLFFFFFFFFYYYFLCYRTSTITIAVLTLLILIAENGNVNVFPALTATMLPPSISPNTETFQKKTGDFLPLQMAPLYAYSCLCCFAWCLYTKIHFSVCCHKLTFVFSNSL